MNHKNKGLTLIEVLIVVTILSALTLSLYTVFKSSVDAWSKSEARLEIYQNARVVLDQLSRELPGAFVGGGAEFTGTNGDPDELEFVTNFGESIYQIKYSVNETDNILVRQYDENPDYDDIDYENIEFGLMISDIQFSYLGVSVPTGYGWGSSYEKDEWTGTDVTTLPEAVKVEIELQDLEDHTFPFETVIYLPNSE